ncbi:acyl-CoA dehydrogenase family protein [Micromonospora sp. NBC_01813]|uniref:acyl-CoA dehydrogenase family protein n=1 Tax=Micromonospora sp. NBC_01813 TaxID=2975988 RepID=UPI002DD7E4BC|nr:acyl-CoA dehydrogenase family protein [Micromonospora sp. NBC_01813]WSA10435.1 acyl-CoA dehydrogenase family protein [Micromonospora sp. NBC_01813]
MSEDLDVLRGQVRDLAARWRAAGRFRPRCDAWLRGHDIGFSRELARRGWIGITWPREHGGGGRSNRARLVVTEELLRAGAPVAAHWMADRQIGPAILRYGTPELQREFLPRIAAAEVTFCLGMSETEAGSDLAAVRTTATRDGDGWRITGAKVWTSHAHRSSHAYVLARTGGGQRRHEGLSEFVVDLASPGVTVRPIIDLQGEHHFNEMIFDDVPVPDGWVIGQVGAGWRQVTEQLSFERGGLERVLSTYPLLEALARSVRSGAEPDAVRAVGELAARLAVLRRIAWEIAADLDTGAAPVRRAALLKHLGTTFERDVTETARRVSGVRPDPTAAGLPGLLAQGILAAPGFSIRGGTTEVLLTLIARGEADGGR